MSTSTIATIEAVRAQQCRAEMETAVAAGLFEPLADCRVLEVVRAADGQDEYALIEVAPPAGGCDAWGGWSAARRVAVAARGPDTERYLFCGCPSVIERQFDAAAGAERTLVRIEGMPAALRRQADLAVYGRYGRTRQDWPDSGGQTAALVDGLECLFNPDGRNNCAAEPITVRLADGTCQRIHVFTHDDDADAAAWTVSRVLRYLAWFYLRRHPWLDVDHLLRATQDSAEHSQAQREYLREGRPLEWAMRGGVETFAGEGLSAIDALGRLVRDSGLHWHIEPVGAAGRLRCQVRLWSEAAGAARSFDLAGGGPLDGSGADPAGCVAAARLTRRLAAGVRQVVVLGAPKQHEVTVELVPGWMPVAEVDAVPPAERAIRKGQALLPEDVEALGKDALQDPWFRAYDRRGADFAAHQDVGRKWVLNEHGRYDGALYNRYAPFDDYQPFRFETVLAGRVAQPGGWMVRPRRFLDPVTQSAEGQPLAAAVEVSFDGGATWSAYTGALRVLDAECGLVLDAENLCQVTPPGVPPRSGNFWYSLVDQQARVRVTAVVEADERVTARAGDPDGPALGGGAVVLAEQALPYRSADGATNVLREAQLSGPDVDSAAAAAGWARRRLEAGRPFALEVRLPGVRLDVELGQRAWGLSWPQARLYERTLAEPLPAIRRIEYRCGDAEATRAWGE